MFFWFESHHAKWVLLDTRVAAPEERREKRGRMYDRDAGMCVHQFTMVNKPYASVFQDIDHRTASESP
jgi:hypothetical protein